MASLNKVFLIGNLTRDPELRHTASGIPVADLRLAVNRRYSNGTGESKEETLFIGVVAWQKQAEAAAQYLKKGSPLHVEGHLQSRFWETPQGERRTTCEVVAERMQFLGRREDGRPQPADPQGADGAPAAVETPDEVPF